MPKKWTQLSQIYSIRYSYIGNKGFFRDHLVKEHLIRPQHLARTNCNFCNNITHIQTNSTKRQDATNRSRFLAFVKPVVYKNSISPWIYLSLFAFVDWNNILNDFVGVIINETWKSKLKPTNTRSIPQEQLIFY